jgi:hypothetical protein
MAERSGDPDHRSGRDKGLAGRIALLMGLIGLSSVRGVRAAVDPGGHPIDLVVSLVECWGFAMLCQVDSLALRRPLSHIFLTMTYFAWPVLAPGYLIWSRGLKGLALAIGIAAAILLARYFSFFAAVGWMYG